MTTVSLWKVRWSNQGHWLPVCTNHRARVSYPDPQSDCGPGYVTQMVYASVQLEVTHQQNQSQIKVILQIKSKIKSKIGFKIVSKATKL